MILMRQPGPDVDGLKDLIEKLPCNIVGLEIGSYAGESAEIFAASGKFSKLYCMDFWKEGYFPDRTTTDAEARFDEIAARYPVIEKVKEHSRELNFLFHKIHLDFIYIDGDHSYDQVRLDIICALRLLKKYAYIGGHDYCKDFPGVVKAVDELVRPGLFFSDSSWLKRL